jgi:predicted lipoprotein
MSSLPRGSSRLVKNLAAVAIALVLVVAMVANTKFLTPHEAAALNPPPFSPEAYATKNFPRVVAALTKNATNITVLAPAFDAEPAVAGKQYGTDVGSGTFAFPVKATGAVKDVDADFILVNVPGLPPKDQVRIPLGAAVSGTPVRDATGTITFSDFVGQTDFQSIANEFKLKVQSEVIAKIDPKSLKGKQVTVVGAWSSGGPPHSYIIQPVSIEAGP